MNDPAARTAAADSGQVDILFGCNLARQRRDCADDHRRLRPFRRFPHLRRRACRAIACDLMLRRRSLRSCDRLRRGQIRVAPAAAFIDRGSAKLGIASGSARGFLRRRRRGGTAGRRRRRLCRVANVLTLGRHHRQCLADLGLLSFLHQDLRQRPLMLVIRFPFHDGFVGLDIGQLVAGGDLVAFLFVPLDERALGHRVRKLRHRDVDGHVGLQEPEARSQEPDEILLLASGYWLLASLLFHVTDFLRHHNTFSTLGFIACSR